ncbi:aspartate dehydrogenase [uncultured Roseobacter sp.]|uniref:aspartate dehydrogenase n=1 Tax=uncultured Roseobacter sp. TaxID=114847 RepID=UPI00262C4FB6|nr:aspartate dehydrogenase [uncultured Roseobacter sp.]
MKENRFQSPAKKVAIIGYGAIGAEICGQLNSDPSVFVSDVLVRPGRTADVRAALGPHVRVVTRPEDLSPDVSFVLECAGHAAVQNTAPAVLRLGFHLGILSAGALADEQTARALEDAALQGGAQISVLPGAIGGIDALAAAQDGLDTVIYAGRKPPQAWRGSPAEEICTLDDLTEEFEFFSGSAREAARLFPKNANVVATVALASVGFDDTRVTLVADPRAAGNSHRIVATGPVVSLDYTTAGSPLASNPKTSALTALSALRALRNQGCLIRI